VKLSGLAGSKLTVKHQPPDSPDPGAGSKQSNGWLGVALQESQAVDRQPVFVGFAIRDQSFEIILEIGKFAVEIDAHQGAGFPDTVDGLLKYIYLRMHRVTRVFAAQQAKGPGGEHGALPLSNRSIERSILRSENDGTDRVFLGALKIAADA
jgi:hypothetical protein